MNNGEYENLHHEALQNSEHEMSKEAWERAVSADLNSEQFISQLQKIDPSDRGKVIGKALQYRISNPSPEAFSAYIENISRSYEYHATYAQQIAGELSITDLESAKNKQKIFEAFIQFYNNEGVVFHGFNGVFEKDIREHGLDVEKRAWDWQELKRISEIGAKAGYKMILGWGNINSQGKIFYDKSAQHTYQYATTSPEWFAQFASEGFHIPNQGGRKSAFQRRDYAQAKQNVIDFCDHMMSAKEEDIRAGKAYPNITEGEKTEIVKFFEKYWPKFAGENSQPKAALIKRRALPGLALYAKDFENICSIWNKTPETVDIEWVINTLLEMDSMGIDMRVTENISPEDVSIITLPDYNVVMGNTEDRIG